MTSNKEFRSIYSQSILRNEDLSTLPTTSYNQFYSNNPDPCAQIVHVLLCYHQVIFFNILIVFNFDVYLLQ